MLKRWNIIFLFLFLPLQYAIADIHGEIIRIIDGDTVDVLVNKTPIRVRLVDIDAPESKQPFGQKSRQFLADMIFRQQVTIVEKGKDRYNRVLGTVFKEDNTNVNESQVSNGMAWAYRYREQATNPAMLDLEQDARQKRLGLWSDPLSSIVEPWIWRRVNNKFRAHETAQGRGDRRAISRLFFRDCKLNCVIA